MDDQPGRVVESDVALVLVNRLDLKATILLVLEPKQISLPLHHLG